MCKCKFWIIVALLISGLAGCQAGGPPLSADAGQDFTVSVGEPPTFDGCGSTGDIVNYKWTITDAPGPMTEDEGKVIREVDPNCSFTLDANMGVDEVGPWSIELEVRDSAGNTATDAVQVEVTE